MAFQLGPTALKPAGRLEKTPRKVIRPHTAHPTRVFASARREATSPKDRGSPLPIDGERAVQQTASNAVPAPRLAAAQPTPGPGPSRARVSGPAAPGEASSQQAIRKAGRWLTVLDAAARPLAVVAASGWWLTVALSISVDVPEPAWRPALWGAVLGGMYALLHDHGVRHLWRPPAAPLRVVVTGGTRGIGKALCREFLRAGDHVVVTSRTLEGAARAARELQEETWPGAPVTGIACDVCDPTSVEALAAAAAAALGGSVDAWVNNAGVSGGSRAFLDTDPGTVEAIVRTNLIGTLLCTRAAVLLMWRQPGGGHVFNMDGAGADGAPTPMFAAYGATKAGIAQAWAELRAETAPLGVYVHNLSPGMVITDLLLEGATPASKRIFNVLCELPETAAAFLVPRARNVVATARSARYVRFLTPLRAIGRLLTAPLRMHRFFDAAGRPTYAAERERVLGRRAKRTERLAARRRRRSAPLGLAYSMSLAASYLLMAMHASAQPPW